MALVDCRDTVPAAVAFHDIMRRIDTALDSGNQQEFARACQERDELLRELMAEVESNGFVMFNHSVVWQ